MVKFYDELYTSGSRLWWRAGVSACSGGTEDHIYEWTESGQVTMYVDSYSMYV